MKSTSRRIHHFLWRPQLSEPKDDHLLELAIAAGGADIVTHNVRDFAQAATFGIRLFITSAVSEKISALTTEEYIAARAARARKGAFRKVLDRVSRRKPLPGDQL